MNILSKQNPAYIYFFYDSPVSKSGELARITNSINSENIKLMVAQKQNKMLILNL